MKTYKHLAQAATVLAISGCSGQTLELDPKYAPLQRIKVDETGLLVKPGSVCTYEGTSYVLSLETLLQNYPVGSRGFDALFNHERIHTMRQIIRGPEWFVLYTIPSFRWSEEQAGWSVEIIEHLQAGDPVKYEEIATFLSGPVYTILGVPMVSYEDALMWVKSLRA